MEPLQIEKAAALKAHENATSKGKSLLEDLLGKKVFVKNIRERIQTIHDIFELNNTTEKDFLQRWNGFEPYEIAHAFELLIVSAYCGPQLPDFTDGSDKYFPRFVQGSPSGVGFSSDVYDYESALETGEIKNPFE